MDLQTLSDRAEIIDLITKYRNALRQAIHWQVVPPGH